MRVLRVRDPMVVRRGFRGRWIRPKCDLNASCPPLTAEDEEDRATIRDAVAATIDVFAATGLHMEGPAFTAAVLDQRANVARVEAATEAVNDKELLYDRIDTFCKPLDGSKDDDTIADGHDQCDDQSLRAAASHRFAAASAAKGRGEAANRNAKKTKGAGARMKARGIPSSNAREARDAIWKAREKIITPRRRLVLERLSQPSDRPVAALFASAYTDEAAEQWMTTLLPRAPLFRRDAEIKRSSKPYAVRWSLNQAPAWWEPVHDWAQRVVQPGDILHGGQSRVAPCKGRLMVVHIRAWRPVGSAEGAGDDVGDAGSVADGLLHSTGSMRRMLVADIAAAEEARAVQQAVSRAAKGRSAKAPGTVSPARAQVEAALAAILGGESGPQEHWLGRQPLTEALCGSVRWLGLGRESTQVPKFDGDAASADGNDTATLAVLAPANPGSSAVDSEAAAPLWLRTLRREAVGGSVSIAGGAADSATSPGTGTDAAPDMSAAVQLADRSQESSAAAAVLKLVGYGDVAPRSHTVVELAPMAAYAGGQLHEDGVSALHERERLWAVAAAMAFHAASEWGPRAPSGAAAAVSAARRSSDGFEHLRDLGKAVTIADAVRAAKEGAGASGPAFTASGVPIRAPAPMDKAVPVRARPLFRLPLTGGTVLHEAGAALDLPAVRGIIAALWPSAVVPLPQVDTSSFAVVAAAGSNAADAAGAWTAATLTKHATDVEPGGEPGHSHLAAALRLAAALAARDEGGSTCLHTASAALLRCLRGAPAPASLEAKLSAVRVASAVVATLLEAAARAEGAIGAALDLVTEGGAAAVIAEVQASGVCSSLTALRDIDGASFDGRRIAAATILRALSGCRLLMHSADVRSRTPVRLVVEARGAKAVVAGPTPLKAAVGALETALWASWVEALGERHEIVSAIRASGGSGTGAELDAAEADPDAGHDALKHEDPEDWLGVAARSPPAGTATGAGLRVPTHLTGRGGNDSRPYSAAGVHAVAAAVRQAIRASFKLRTESGADAVQDAIDAGNDTMLRTLLGATPSPPPSPTPTESAAAAPAGVAPTAVVAGSWGDGVADCASPAARAMLHGTAPAQGHRALFALSWAVCPDEVEREFTSVDGGNLWHAVCSRLAHRRASRGKAKRPTTAQAREAIAAEQKGHLLIARVMEDSARSAHGMRRTGSARSMSDAGAGPLAELEDSASARIKAKLDIWQPDRQGRTPFALALACGSASLAGLLMKLAYEGRVGSPHLCHCLPAPARGKSVMACQPACCTIAPDAVPRTVGARAGAASGSGRVPSLAGPEAVAAMVCAVDKLGSTPMAAALDRDATRTAPIVAALAALALDGSHDAPTPSATLSMMSLFGQEFASPGDVVRDGASYRATDGSIKPVAAASCGAVGAAGELAGMAVACNWLVSMRLLSALNFAATGGSIDAAARAVKPDGSFLSAVPTDRDRPCMSGAVFVHDVLRAAVAMREAAGPAAAPPVTSMWDAACRPGRDTGCLLEKAVALTSTRGTVGLALFSVLVALAPATDTLPRNITASLKRWSVIDAHLVRGMEGITSAPGVHLTPFDPAQQAHGPGSLSGAPEDALADAGEVVADALLVTAACSWARAVRIEGQIPEETYGEPGGSGMRSPSAGLPDLADAPAAQSAAGGWRLACLWLLRAGAAAWGLRQQAALAPLVANAVRDARKRVLATASADDTTGGDGDGTAAAAAAAAAPGTGMVGGVEVPSSYDGGRELLRAGAAGGVAWRQAASRAADTLGVSVSSGSCSVLTSTGLMGLKDPLVLPRSNCFQTLLASVSVDAKPLLFLQESLLAALLGALGGASAPAVLQDCQAQMLAWLRVVQLKPEAPLLAYGDATRLARGPVSLLSLRAHQIASMPPPGAIVGESCILSAALTAFSPFLARLPAGDPRDAVPMLRSLEGSPQSAAILGELLAVIDASRDGHSGRFSDATLAAAASQWRCDRWDSMGLIPAAMRSFLESEDAMSKALLFESFSGDLTLRDVADGAMDCGRVSVDATRSARRHRFTGTACDPSSIALNGPRTSLPPLHAAVAACLQAFGTGTFRHPAMLVVPVAAVARALYRAGASPLMPSAVDMIGCHTVEGSYGCKLGFLYGMGAPDARVAGLLQGSVGSLGSFATPLRRGHTSKLGLAVRPPRRAPLHHDFPLAHPLTAALEQICRRHRVPADMKDAALRSLLPNAGEDARPAMQVERSDAAWGRVVLALSACSDDFGRLPPAHLGSEAQDPGSGLPSLVLPQTTTPAPDDADARFVVDGGSNYLLGNAEVLSADALLDAATGRRSSSAGGSSPSPLDVVQRASWSPLAPGDDPAAPAAGPATAMAEALRLREATGNQPRQRLETLRSDQAINSSSQAHLSTSASVPAIAAATMGAGATPAQLSAMLSVMLSGFAAATVRCVRSSVTKPTTEPDGTVPRLQQSLGASPRVLVCASAPAGSLSAAIVEMSTLLEAAASGDTGDAASASQVGSARPPKGGASLFTEVLPVLAYVDDGDDMQACMITPLRALLRRLHWQFIGPPKGLSIGIDDVDGRILPTGARSVPRATLAAGLPAAVNMLLRQLNATNAVVGHESQLLVAEAACLHRIRSSALVPRSTACSATRLLFAHDAAQLAGSLGLLDVVRRLVAVGAVETPHLLRSMIPGPSRGAWAALEMVDAANARLDITTAVAVRDVAMSLLVAGTVVAHRADSAARAALRVAGADIPEPREWVADGSAGAADPKAITGLSVCDPDVAVHDGSDGDDEPAMTLPHCTGLLSLAGHSHPEAATLIDAPAWLLSQGRVAPSSSCRPAGIAIGDVDEFAAGVADASAARSLPALPVRQGRVVGAPDDVLARFVGRACPTPLLGALALAEAAMDELPECHLHAESDADAVRGVARDFGLQQDDKPHLLGQPERLVLPQLRTSCATHVESPRSHKATSIGPSWLGWGHPQCGDEAAQVWQLAGAKERDLWPGLDAVTREAASIAAWQFIAHADEAIADARSAAAVSGLMATAMTVEALIPAAQVAGVPVMVAATGLSDHIENVPKALASLLVTRGSNLGVSPLRAMVPLEDDLHQLVLSFPLESHASVPMGTAMVPMVLPLLMKQPDGDSSEAAVVAAADAAPSTSLTAEAAASSACACVCKPGSEPDCFLALDAVTAYAVLARDNVAAMMGAGVTAGWMPAIGRRFSSPQGAYVSLQLAAHELTVDAGDASGRTAIAYHAAVGDWIRVQRLLAIGADANGRLGGALTRATMLASCLAKRFSVPHSPLSGALQTAVREGSPWGMMRLPESVKNALIPSEEEMERREAEGCVRDTALDTLSRHRYDALAASTTARTAGDDGRSPYDGMAQRDMCPPSWITAASLLEFGALSDAAGGWEADLFLRAKDGSRLFNVDSAPAPASHLVYDTNLSHTLAQLLRNNPLVLAIAAACNGEMATDAVLALSAASAWEAMRRGAPQNPAASHTALLAALSSTPWRVSRQVDSGGGMSSSLYYFSPQTTPTSALRGTLGLDKAALATVDQSVVWVLKHSSLGKAALHYARDWRKRVMAAKTPEAAAMMPRSSLLLLLAQRGMWRAAAYAAEICGEASGIGQVRCLAPICVLPADRFLDMKSLRIEGCAISPLACRSAVETAAAAGEWRTLVALFASDAGAGAEDDASAGILDTGGIVSSGAAAFAGQFDALSTTDPVARWAPALRTVEHLVAMGVARDGLCRLLVEPVDAVVAELMGEDPVRAGVGDAYDAALNDKVRGHVSDMLAMPSALWLAAANGRASTLEILLEKAAELHAAPPSMLGGSSGSAGSSHPILAGAAVVAVDRRSGFGLVEAAVASGSLESLRLVLRHCLQTPPPPMAGTGTRAPVLTVFGASGGGLPKWVRPTRSDNAPVAGSCLAEDVSTPMPSIAVASPLAVALAAGNAAAASVLLRHGSRVQTGLVGAVVDEIAMAAAEVASAPLVRPHADSPTLPGFGRALGRAPAEAAAAAKAGRAEDWSVMGESAGPWTVWLHADTDELLCTMRLDNPVLFTELLDHIWQSALAAAPAEARRAALSPPVGWSASSADLSGASSADVQRAAAGDDRFASAPAFEWSSGATTARESPFRWSFSAAVGRRALARAMCRVRVWRGKVQDRQVVAYPPVSECLEDLDGGWECLRRPTSSDCLAGDAAYATLLEPGLHGWEGVMEAAVAAALAPVASIAPPCSGLPAMICEDDPQLFPTDEESAAGVIRDLDRRTKASSAVAFATGLGAGGIAVAAASSSAAQRLEQFALIDDAVDLTGTGAGSSGRVSVLSEVEAPQWSLQLPASSMPSDVGRLLAVADAPGSAWPASSLASGSGDSLGLGDADAALPVASSIETLAGAVAATSALAPGSVLLALLQSFPEVRACACKARAASAAASLAWAGHLGLATVTATGRAWPPAAQELTEGATEDRLRGSTIPPAVLMGGKRGPLVPHLPLSPAGPTASMLSIKAVGLVARSRRRLGRTLPGFALESHAAEAEIAKAAAERSTDDDDDKLALVVPGSFIGVSESLEAAAQAAERFASNKSGSTGAAMHSSQHAANTAVLAAAAAHRVEAGGAAEADDGGTIDPHDMSGLKWITWMRGALESEDEAAAAVHDLDAALQRGTSASAAAESTSRPASSASFALLANLGDDRNTEVWAALSVVPSRLQVALTGHAGVAAVFEGPAAEMLEREARPADEADALRLAAWAVQHRRTFEAVSVKMYEQLRAYGMDVQRRWMDAMLSPAIKRGTASVVSEALFVLEAEDLGGEALSNTTPVLAAAAAALYAVGPAQAPLLLARARGWPLLTTAVEARAPELVRVVLSCGQSYLDAPALAVAADEAAAKAGAASAMAKERHGGALAEANRIAEAVVRHWASDRGASLANLAASAMQATVTALSMCTMTPTLSIAPAEAACGLAEAALAEIDDEEARDPKRADLQELEPDAPSYLRAVWLGEQQHILDWPNRRAVRLSRRQAVLAQSDGFRECEDRVGGVMAAALADQPAGSTPETARREAAKAFVDALDHAVAAPAMAQLETGAPLAVFSPTSLPGPAGVSCGMAVVARGCAKLVCAVARRAEGVLRSARRLAEGSATAAGSGKGGSDSTAPRASLMRACHVASITASAVRVTVEAWASALCAAAASRSASGVMVDGGAAGVGGVIAVLATEGLLPRPRATMGRALVADGTAAAALAAAQAMSKLQAKQSSATAGGVEDGWQASAVSGLLAAVHSAVELGGGILRGDPCSDPGRSVSSTEDEGGPVPFDIEALAVGGARFVRCVLWPLGCTPYLPLGPATAASSAAAEGEAVAEATRDPEGIDPTLPVLPPMPAEGEACVNGEDAEPLAQAAIGRVLGSAEALDRAIAGATEVLRGRSARRREASCRDLGRAVVSVLSPRQAAVLADPWGASTPLLPIT